MSVWGNWLAYSPILAIGSGLGAGYLLSIFVPPDHYLNTWNLTLIDLGMLKTGLTLRLDMQFIVGTLIMLVIWTFQHSGILRTAHVQIALTIGGLLPLVLDLRSALAEADALAAGLLRRVDLDTEAFNAVMAAFKLPKETDDEKQARAAAIQQGYKEAVQSPLAIAYECVSVLNLCHRLRGKTNPNALSDLGVAAQQAYAGLEGAIMNVKINLPSIKDEQFRSKITSELSHLLRGGREAKDDVYDFVCERL